MNIKELAEQAGIKFTPDWGECYTGNVQIKRFAELVAAAEREACAKLCEKHGEAQVDNYAVHSAYDCAAVIRARENNNG